LSYFLIMSDMVLLSTCYNQGWMPRWNILFSYSNCYTNKKINEFEWYLQRKSL